MKALHIALAISFLGLANLIIAQNACPCCTTEHESFDFWIGDWIVYDTLGSQVGENTIVKLENGCNVSEHWRGSGGLTGRSFNYYSKADSSWNQLWIDNGGNQLQLKGRGDGTSMTMYSIIQEGRSGAVYKNRLVWTLREDGTVSQVWDVIDENGSILQNAFFGIYKKRL